MRAIALVLASSIFMFSKPLLACSVCGCDPSGGTLGLDRPTMSDLRLAVEDRYLQKESGSNIGGTREGEREDRIGVRFQYSPPVPRLSLELDVPIYAWKAHYGLNGLQDDTNQGLSDVALSARYELLHFGGVVPRHVLVLTGTLKTPTGNNSHLAPVDNGVPDEHKQIGTGTWDEFLGLGYTYGDFPTVAYANASVRINGTNGRGNHYGNALFGTLGVRRSFLESRSLYLALEGQVRNAGRDTVPSPGPDVPRAYDPNSGGFLAYATGTVGYAVTQNLLVRGTLQLPVATALNGVQSEHPVGYLTLAYDFTL
jgi:hypothetical protein